MPLEPTEPGFRRLNILRIEPWRLNSCRIAQTCFGFSGAFGPISLPAFQGLLEVRNRSGWLMATSYEAAPKIRTANSERPGRANWRHRLQTQERTFLDVR